MKTSLVFLVLALVLCVAVSAEAKGSSYAGAATPYYITAQRMQAEAVEHHSWGKGYVEVLDAACVGQGYSLGTFPYQRYHLFLCFLTAKGWTAEYHFNITRTAGRIVYTPTLITSYRTP